MSIYCTLVMLDESHTEGCASSRDTPTPTKENPTMPENPYRGRQAAYSSAFVWDEGVAAERARILALLDEPRAYRLALAEYAARREQGHDRFEAMRLAVAAVRALVGGDDCARSLPRDTPTPEDTHEWRERDS